MQEQELPLFPEIFCVQCRLEGHWEFSNEAFSPYTRPNSFWCLWFVDCYMFTPEFDKAGWIGVRTRIWQVWMDQSYPSPNRLDQRGEAVQKAISTSPLDMARRVNQNSYVERPIRSPNEEIRLLQDIYAGWTGATSAPDRSDLVPLWVKSRSPEAWKRILLWGKTSPPYKYKGPLPIEGHNRI
jgi:hypothetical protein